MSERQSTAVENRLVLVVEDDDAVRHSLKFSLEVEGYSVKDYSTARDLLKEPEVAEAACLLIDYNLPDMNGLELLRELRIRHVALPALMITSHPNTSVRRAAANADVRIIEKPFLNSALMEGVEGACGASSPARHATMIGETGAKR